MSLNLSRSNLQEDKYNFNEEITKMTMDSINANIIIQEEKVKIANLIIQEEAEIKKKSFKIKPKLVFKTKFIKIEDIEEKFTDDDTIQDDNENDFQDEMNFDNYNSFINYSKKKNVGSFPTVDYEIFNTFIKYKYKNYIRYKQNQDNEIYIHDVINLHPKSLLCLKGKNWLNDEVYIFITKIINSYADLLVQRSKYYNHPKVYIFNTFFYQSLEKEISEKTYNFGKYKKRFEKKKVILI